MRPQYSFAALLLALILWGAASLAARQEWRDEASRVNPRTLSGYSYRGTILWPSQESRDLTVRVGLAAEVVSKVDSASLPVLLPRESANLPQPERIHVSPASYSASLSDPEEGISLVIFGSREFFVPPSSAPPIRPLRDRLRGLPAEIRQSEGAIWSATWEQYGAGYIIKLSCDANLTSACKDDSYIRAVAENLVFVGGSFETFGE